MIYPIASGKSYSLMDETYLQASNIFVLQTCGG